jgi:predicted HTH domain antitoxin
MAIITTRVPEELAKEVERIAQAEALDKSTTIKRLLIKAVEAWKMDHALKLYQEGKISIGKAAETAGVSLWEILDNIVKRKIPLQITRDDLEEDLKAALAESW